MALKSPIKIELCRPFDTPETPYGRCENCQYVSMGLVSERRCPLCGSDAQQGYTIWPDPELAELWRDEVAMWNQKRAELAVVTAAMYFEASVFHLIYWATVWLDPDLNWIGCSLEEFADKEKRIWAHLDSIKSSQDTNAALEKVFGVRGKGMLENVLGAEDAAFFWENYQKLAEQRNHIVHRGSRIMYHRADGPQAAVAGSEPEQLLAWCLRFVPVCWEVFAKLHNEYIHEPMWERKRKKKAQDAQEVD